MKSRLEEYEKEAAQLREMRDAQEREALAIAAVAGPADGSAMETEDDKQAADERSIYVGNVSGYSAKNNERPFIVYCSCLFSGRLQLHSRRNPGSLCILWNYQPRNHPL